MTDRFTRGFIAGVLAGIVSSIWNLSSFHLLNFAELRFLDFAAILTYGREAINIYEDIFSLLTVISFYGLLGIFFSYLLLYIRNENLLFKGWVFGVTTWFISYVTTYLFQVPELLIIPFHTALSNFIGASIYGLMLAGALNILEARYKAETEMLEKNEGLMKQVIEKKYVLIPAPAMKSQTNKKNYKLFTPVSIKEILTKKTKGGFKKPRKI